MTQKADNRTAPMQKRSATISILILVLNAVLLFCAFFLGARYVSAYRERLWEENLGNIKNMNQSAASNATALIESWNQKLNDISLYLQRHTLTCQEMLVLLEDINADGERLFELIGQDYTGFAAERQADGTFVPVSYSGEAYAALQRALDDTTDAGSGKVCFVPEFTESSSALKYCGVYRHVPIKGEDGSRAMYTLLLASRSQDVLAVFNSQSDYAGQSAVLMDGAGNYIVSNADFKSTNFFQYLYVYNDLSLDERTAIAEQMTASPSGEIYFKNAAGQDCVFRYARMQTSNWYCITCVPLDSFRTAGSRIEFVLYAGAALLLLLIVDVVWLRRLNGQLRVSMQHEMEASDAKTDFLSRMSHDIRTPLNGIIGLTGLAMDENNPPRTREYLENVHVSGRFLLGLVNDILDMSKVERGLVELHPEPYTGGDLRQYVKAVVEPLCKDKGVAFHIDAPPDDAAVMLDRLRFNQVLFNLLSNAVKYTPAGGLVELVWRRKPLPYGRCGLDFCVRDNGIGMSEAFQEHMFEAFSQENAQTADGTGLGLSIVRSLIGLMGGTITVKSVRGEGTEFHVHVETAFCPDQAASAPAQARTALEGKRVLLCEDNRINVLFAKRLLEKWGVLVDTAENGSVGLAMFRDAPPRTYDAVLMDVMMPVMNGMDATRAIRALDRADARDVPIIAMTANAYDTDVENCLAAGMNAHMGKPIDAMRMHELLADMIR